MLQREVRDKNFTRPSSWLNIIFDNLNYYLKVTLDYLRFICIDVAINVGYTPKICISSYTQFQKGGSAKTSILNNSFAIPNKLELPIFDTSPLYKWLDFRPVFFIKKVFEVVMKGNPETLNLSNLSISDADLKHLVESLNFKDNDSLLKLDLSNNNIGPQGLKALAKVCPKKLIDITLDDNNLSEKDFEVLPRYLRPTSEIIYTPRYHMHNNRLKSDENQVWINEKNLKYVVSRILRQKAVTHLVFNESEYNTEIIKQLEQRKLNVESLYRIQFTGDIAEVQCLSRMLCNINSSSLRFLKLTHCDLSTQNIRCISAILTKQKLLTSFNLSSYSTDGIGPGDAQENLIKSLKGLIALSELKLSFESPELFKKVDVEFLTKLLKSNIPLVSLRVGIKFRYPWNCNTPPGRFLKALKTNTSLTKLSIVYAKNWPECLSSFAEVFTINETIQKFQIRIEYEESISATDFLEPLLYHNISLTELVLACRDPYQRLLNYTTERNERLLNQNKRIREAIDNSGNKITIHKLKYLSVFEYNFHYLYYNCVCNTRENGFENTMFKSLPAELIQMIFKMCHETYATVYRKRIPTVLSDLGISF